MMYSYDNFFLSTTGSYDLPALYVFTIFKSGNHFFCKGNENEKEKYRKFVGHAVSLQCLAKLISLQK